MAISGTLYKEGGVEKFQGIGEELASYYYKGRYILSRNFVNQRNKVTKAKRRVIHLKMGSYLRENVIYLLYKGHKMYVFPVCKEICVIHVCFREIQGSFLFKI